MSNHRNKNFITMSGVKSGLACELDYPRPIFRERPDMRMRRSALKEMMAHRAEECRRMIDLIEGIDGTKEQLCRYINNLHDFHNSLKFHSAMGMGEPVLWEE